MRTNKTFSILFTVALILSLTTSAFAANMDIYNIETNEVYRYDEFIADDEQFNNVISLINENPSNYLYEYNDVGYNFEELNTNFGETGNLEDALEKTKEVPLPKEDLEVANVSAIDANTISVTFEGMEEAVEITLEEALVHGQTEVTFLYEEVEYTAELEEAWIDDAVVLAEAIEAAEAAIAELPTVEEVTIEDAQAVADAKGLVEAVKALDAEAVVEGEEVIAELEAKIADLEAEEKLAAALETLNNAADEFEAKVAIENADLGLDLTAYNEEDAVGKLAIATAVYNAKEEAVFESAEEVQAVIDGYFQAIEDAEFDAAFDAVNTAADAGEMRTALETPALGLDLTDYNTLTSIQKATVADNVLTARNAIPTTGEFEDFDALETAFNTEVDAFMDAALAAQIAEASTAVDDAVTASDRTGALADATLTQELIDDAQQAHDDAYELVVALPEDAVTLGGENVQDLLDRLEDVQADIDEAQEFLPVVAVNDATDKLEMLEAIQNPELGLDLTEFNALTSAERNRVLDALIAGQDYANDLDSDPNVLAAEAIQTVIDDEITLIENEKLQAIALQAAIDAIDELPEVAELTLDDEDAVIEARGLVDAYLEFNDLDGITAVIGDVTNNGTLVALENQMDQLKEDEAVSAAIAAVNTAATAEDMMEAIEGLEDATLGAQALDLSNLGTTPSDYTTSALTYVEQLTVAQALVDEIAENGDYADIDAIEAALDAAIQAL